MCNIASTEDTIVSGICACLRCLWYHPGTFQFEVCRQKTFSYFLDKFLPQTSLRYCSHILPWLFDYVISTERGMYNGTTVRMTMNDEVLKTGNIQPMTCHESPGEEKRYSSTLYFISALDGMSGQRHAPTALTPVKRPDTNFTGSQAEPKFGREGYGLGPIGIRSPGRPSRSESLYRHALQSLYRHALHSLYRHFLQAHVKCKTEKEKEPALPCFKVHCRN